MTADRIYFAQHGLAVDKAENPERPLSDTGIQQTKKMAETLYHAKATISGIFHSGKLRASQTADIFAATSGISTTTMIEGLSPNDDVELLAKNLVMDNALYIGHLPHLAKLVNRLVSVNENSNIIKLQNSAVVCLGKIDNSYQLLWYLTPGLIE
jgi:phosphohistidine phosphatase